MKLSRLGLAAVLSMMAGAALARPNPTPPPSGIVVHLFGPGSITSGVLPTFVGPLGVPTASRQPSSAAAVGNGTATGPGTQPNAAAVNGAASPAAYPEPTMNQVLHQMFVVGDPTEAPAQKLAPGRAAEHPLAANP